MKKYAQYKDSGVDWLGNVPQHWEVTKLKFLGDAFGGLTYSPNDIVDNDEEGLLVLRSSNIQSGKLSLNDNVYVNTKISDKLKLRVGDILICSRNGSQNLIGKNICIGESMEGNTFGAFMMVFRSDSWKFLKHYFNSPIFSSQSSLFLTATINQLTSSTLKSFWIAIPKSITEQSEISKYLDQKTSQIDKLINDKQKLIDLLNEERTAVINQAVTKGLTPDVPMKDSGIEWLGEISSDRDIRRIGDLTECLTGFAFKSEEFSFDEGIKLVRGDNVTEGALRWGDKTRLWKNVTTDMEKFYLQEYDILVGMDGSKVGKNFAMVSRDDLPLLLVQRVARIRSSSQEIAKFIFYSICSYNFKYHVNLNKTDPAIPHITLKNITDFKLFLPSTEIGLRTLINELEYKLVSLDKAMIAASREIDLLVEYKKALISEVVTGKLDVRG